MTYHANANLTLRQRHELVLEIEAGSTLWAAAAARNVAPATAHRWWVRWRDADPEQRASLVCLHDRSSRQLRSVAPAPAVMANKPTSTLGSARRQPENQPDPSDVTARRPRQ